MICGPQATLFELRAWPVAQVRDFVFFHYPSLIYVIIIVIIIIIIIIISNPFILCI